MTQLAEVLDKARDVVTVRHVFGDPIERDGMVIIPVARISSGGGGAGGEGGGSTGGVGPDSGEGHGSGWGLGYGFEGHPVGVYVIKDGTVKWQPAFDVNQAVARGTRVALAALVAFRVLVQARTKRRLAKLERSG